MRLVDLDENTVLLILKHLEPKDLICVQLTCKWGKTVIASHDSILWKTLCAERFATWNNQLIIASQDRHESGTSSVFILALILWLLLRR